MRLLTCLGAAVMTRATLYEKLGGRDAVNAAVDKFYVKVNAVVWLVGPAVAHQGQGLTMTSSWVCCTVVLSWLASAAAWTPWHVTDMVDGINSTTNPELWPFLAADLCTAYKCSYCAAACICRSDRQLVHPAQQY
jgi:hypothetical protein